MNRFYFFLFLLLITISGCLTPLLHDDFDSRSPNIINTNLEGSIPGEPNGDRINYVIPTVISVQEPQLTNQSLRINNRVDFQLADHDAFDRYIVSWKGIQVNSLSSNTIIDFMNEDDEIVLTLHFDENDLEVLSDYPATPPQFSFQTDVVHQFVVVFIVLGTNGSASYADITVSEEDGNSREWANMPLLGNQIETLKTVRFRAEDSCPYILDNLTANAN